MEGKSEPSQILDVLTTFKLDSVVTFGCGLNRKKYKPCNDEACVVIDTLASLCGMNNLRAIVIMSVGMKQFLSCVREGKSEK